MKIGIDCRTIGESAGVGIYTRGLVKYLLENDGHNQYALFFNNDFSGTGDYARPNAEIIFLPSRKLKKFLPIIYSHFIVAGAMNREKCDVCLFPANIIPLGYRGKAVVVAHDMAVYKLPQFFPNKLIAFDRRIVVPRSLGRADMIVAVSESTKGDIIELFGISEKKIKTVYEGTELKKSQDKSWGRIAADVAGAIGRSG